MKPGDLAANLGTAKGALEAIARLDQIAEQLRTADRPNRRELIELQRELEIVRRTLWVLTSLTRQRIEVLSSLTQTVGAHG